MNAINTFLPNASTFLNRTQTKWLFRRFPSPENEHLTVRVLWIIVVFCKTKGNSVLSYRTKGYRGILKCAFCCCFINSINWCLQYEKQRVVLMHNNYVMGKCFEYCLYIYLFVNHDTQIISNFVVLSWIWIIECGPIESSFCYCKKGFV